MNTRVIMALSAVFLGLIGVGFIFLPQEILNGAGISPSETLQLAAQVLGALFFGFAILNWMFQWSVIGGIYNRPVTLANFSHFLVGGLALLKAAMKYGELHWIIWALAGTYTIFAVMFGVLFMKSPVSTQRLSSDIK